MADKRDTPGQWIALSEAAAYFRVSERTLRRRVKAGELRTRKESGHVFVLVYGPLDRESDKADKADSLTTAPDLAALQAENRRLADLLSQVEGERDYLRQALAAALATQQKLIEARPYFESPRRWWEFWKA